MGYYDTSKQCFAIHANLTRKTRAILLFRFNDFREINDTEAEDYIRVSQDVKNGTKRQLVPALAKKLKVTKMNPIKPIT